MTTAEMPKYFVNYVKETLGIKHLEVAALEDQELSHAQKYDALFEAAQQELANPTPEPIYAEPQATVYEEPVVEQAVYEEPVADQATYEEPAAEQAAFEEPVAEQAAAVATASVQSYQDGSMTDGQTAREFHEEHMHTVRLQQAGITEAELAARVAVLMEAMGSELPQAAPTAEAAATTAPAAAADPMSVGQTAREFYEEHMHTVRLQQAGITEAELASRVAVLMEAMGSELPQAAPAAEAAAAAPAAAADPMSVGQTARDFHDEHMHGARLQQAGITEDELAARVASLLNAFNSKAA